MEIFAARTRRSVDSGDNNTNTSIYHDLSSDPILPPVIEPGTFRISVYVTMALSSLSVPSVKPIFTPVLSVLKSSVDQIASFSGKLVTGFDDSQSDGQGRKHRSKRFAYERPTRIASIMQLYDRLNRDPNLCQFMTENELTMPGDALYDVDIQLESQARLALSISHFLSSFYQVVNPAEDFPLRKAELELTDEQLIGEVLAAAGGDYKVVGVGIFFDRGKFKNYRLPYFGPYAFRPEKDISRKYTVVDWAGLPDGYENENWFRVSEILLKEILIDG